VNCGKGKKRTTGGGPKGGCNKIRREGTVAHLLWPHTSCKLLISYEWEVKGRGLATGYGGEVQPVKGIYGRRAEDSHKNAQARALGVGQEKLEGISRMTKKDSGSKGRKKASVNAIE